MADVLQDNKRFYDIVQRATELAEEAQVTVEELVSILREYADRQETFHE